MTMDLPKCTPLTFEIELSDGSREKYYLDHELNICGPDKEYAEYIEHRFALSLRKYPHWFFACSQLWTDSW